MDDYKVLADNLLKGRLQNDSVAQYRNPFIKLLVLSFPISVYTLAISVFNIRSHFYVSNTSLLLSIFVMILLQSADFRSHKVQSYVWKFLALSIIAFFAIYNNDIGKFQSAISSKIGLSVNIATSDNVRVVLVFCSLLFLLKSPQIFSLRDVNFYFRLNRKSSRSRLLEIAITTFFVVQNSVSRRFRIAWDVAKRRLYMMDRNINTIDRISRSASIFFLTLWEQLHEMVLLASSLYQDRKFNSEVKTSDRWLRVAWGFEDLIALALIVGFYVYVFTSIKH